MRKKQPIIWIKVFVLYLMTWFAVQSTALAAIEEDLIPTYKQQRISAAHSVVLTKYHYSKLPFDDNLSMRIYNTYLRSLDPQRVFFVKADIDAFNKHSQYFDDYLRRSNLMVPFQMYEQLIKRIDERTAFVENILKTEEFDLASNKKIYIDRSELPYAKDQKELDNIWRERLQNELITLMVSDKDRTLEDAKERLLKRYKVRGKRLAQNTKDDIFDLFMNVVARSFDPHSGYYSAKHMEDFNIGMSLSLQGIGTVLRQDEDAVKIMEIVPGGPADLTKQLNVADEIIGIAQGDNGEFMDIAGLRLDKVVDKIRGKKGTVVRLQILGNKGKGPEKIVRIVRDTVKLDKQAAKSEIKTVLSEKAVKSDNVEVGTGNVEVLENDNGANENGANESGAYRIGVITLPTFYSDFEGNHQGKKDYRSTTRDVKNLLTKMQKEAPIDGLIIDLRGNGGGSLQEVIDLSSIFLKDPHKTIVQTRNFDGRIELQKSSNDKQLYDGPLLVMTDRLSASASEIFAGSMQDQGRAIIAGSTTFGKGTVQTMLNLEALLSKTEKPGQSKVTIATFYRASGETTQEKGVVPDIEFPSLYDPQEIGEAKEHYVLPWDRIKPASDYRPDVIENLAILKAKSRERFESNERNILFKKQADNLYEQWRTKKISLNLEARKKELRDKERVVLKRQNRLRELYGYKALTLEEFKNEDGTYSDLIEKTKVDVLLDEAVEILRDYIDLTK